MWYHSFLIFFGMVVKIAETFCWKHTVTSQLHTTVTYRIFRSCMNFHDVFHNFKYFESLFFFANAIWMNTSGRTGGFAVQSNIWILTVLWKISNHSTICCIKLKGAENLRLGLKLAIDELCTIFVLLLWEWANKTYPYVGFIRTWQKLWLLVDGQF